MVLLPFATHHLSVLKHLATMTHEAIVTNGSLYRYDFPWSPAKYIPFYGGAEYHDYHHYVGGQSQSNFASVFTYCDYIYGTDKGYRYQKKILSKLEEETKGAYMKSGRLIRNFHSRS